MECTLLTKQEVCDNQIQIFKKYGTNAAVTDFSLLLGIEVSSNHTCDTLYYRDKDYIDTRAADYWTKTREKDKVIAISSYSFGYNSPKNMKNRYLGIRPVIKYSDILDECLNKRLSDKEVIEVEYGEYPQTICDEKIRLELEKEYKEDKLVKTNKTYVINSTKEPYNTKILQEYQCNGRKYIRFIADGNQVRTKLSNKKYIEYGKAYWIKVEPIIWMIDKEEDIAVSKKLLISGMPFDNNYKESFEETEIYKYLNNYFIKEIITEKKIRDKSKLEEVEEYLENLSLQELQELRIIIEKQIKKEVKIKCKGGIRWDSLQSKNKLEEIK